MRKCVWKFQDFEENAKMKMMIEMVNLKLLINIEASYKK